MKEFNKNEISKLIKETNNAEMSENAVAAETSVDDSSNYFLMKK